MKLLGKHLSRRTVLRGALSATVGLPLLDAMMPVRARAQSSSSSPRYVVMFCGQSIGCRAGSLFEPATEGPDYEVTPALLPLVSAAGDLRGDVRVVTDLRVPWEEGGVIPPGGRVVNFHDSPVGPILSGVQATSGTARPRGETSDRIMANVLPGARFDALTYRAQPNGYRGGGAKGLMSYQQNASGNLVEVTPLSSPRIAYDQLFSAFAPEDPALAAARARRLAQDKSVLDLVLTQANALQARLGAADRRRLDEHFTHIRTLEARIRQIPPEAVGQCLLLPDPGEDPPTETTEEDGRDFRVIGYSGEERRASVLVDLIHMALVCEQTRVATLMLSFAQTFMNADPIIGVRFDVHELSHEAGEGLPDQTRLLAWHIGFFAQLVHKLKATTEGAGTLLDHTAVTLLFEGGHGFDPESNSNNSAHSTENMAALSAGRVGGLGPGGHIRGNGAHPAQVVLSAMRACGHTGPLGEVTTPLETLFG